MTQYLLMAGNWQTELHQQSTNISKKPLLKWYSDVLLPGYGKESSPNVPCGSLQIFGKICTWGLENGLNNSTCGYVITSLRNSSSSCGALAYMKRQLRIMLQQWRNSTFASKALERRTRRGNLIFHFNALKCSSVMIVCTQCVDLWDQPGFRRDICIPSQPMLRKSTNN